MSLEQSVKAKVQKQLKNKTAHHVGENREQGLLADALEVVPSPPPARG